MAFAFMIFTGCGGQAEAPLQSRVIPKDSSQLEAKTESDTASRVGYSVVNGLKMYYEIHGSGSPLVLIHGGGSTIQISFGAIMPLLAKSHKIIAVELQAHGRTADRNQPSSFEQDADDVAALLKNIGVGRADVLGFSNGGHTGMQFAIRHPEMVHKLIVASAFYKRNGVRPGLFEHMPHATVDSMPADLREAYLKEIRDPRLLQIMFERDRARMAAFRDWPDQQIKSIKSPSLLLLGDADIVLPEHAIAMSHLIPDCRLAIIPAGHGDYLGQTTASGNARQALKYVCPLIEQFLSAN